jgi:predicted TIM-barrel fold metal-dependent hydrolase
MQIVDAQVHAYERNHPGRPWVGHLHGPPSASGDEMVAAMDAAGVDGALLVSPYSFYRYDASYALEVGAAHPGRFGLIKPVNPNDPAVEEDIANWAKKKGAVAIRILLTYEASEDPVHPGMNRILAAAARHSLPVNLLCWGRLGQAKGLITRHPNTVIVIDHLGLPQPFEPPVPAQPWAELPKVLELAAYDNVRIKISGACTLSHERFPYNDIWDPLARMFEAFGFDRCMWGTDWTRAIALLTFKEGVDAFRLTDRLSEREKTALMGATLGKVYGWQPAKLTA